MGKPYSDHLRRTVVQAIVDGYTREEIAETYEVSLSSVGRFVKRWRTTGHERIPEALLFDLFTTAPSSTRSSRGIPFDVRETLPRPHVPRLDTPMRRLGYDPQPAPSPSARSRRSLRGCAPEFVAQRQAYNI